MPLDLKLAGKHVVVTGSAGGIGVQTARRFLEQGANVTLHYNRQHETLKPLLEEYKDATALLQADSTNEEHVAALFSDAVKKFGVVHFLVANHAIYESEEVFTWDMPLEQFRRTLDVNVTGVFLFCREYLRQLKAHTDSLKESGKIALVETLQASIVIIGSTAGAFGEAKHLDYAASKSALMYGFVRSLKNEIVHIAPLGRVNCAQPGWIATPMAEEAIRTGVHYQALHTTPLEKIGTPDDVAMAILTLSSHVTSGHVTGSIVEIAGGCEGRFLNELEHIKDRESMRDWATAQIEAGL